tara:strand:- start:102 stop:776 length:675 start_codon:yes stop_codon:yes gene_type:complete
MRNEEYFAPRKINVSQIKNLMKGARNYLTHREIDFLGSILSQSEWRTNLSIGQERWLRTIEDKYSKDKLKEMSLWEKNFSDEHRDIATKVALYYETTQYYAHCVQTVMSDPENFVLSKKEWDIFCENKYALKIRANYEEPLKFKVADCVQVRANNKIDIANVPPDSYPNKSARRLMANKVGFILEVDAKPVTRAAKGSRIYKLLFTGETSPVYAHESDLKRKRK